MQRTSHPWTEGDVHSDISTPNGRGTRVHQGQAQVEALTLELVEVSKVSRERLRWRFRR